MSQRPLSIFISHPSNVLTDSWPHGDGLIAHAILRRLADRGHTLHVAVPLSALEKPMPGNVHLYPIEARVPHTRDGQNFAYRMEYAVRVRRLFSQLRQKTEIDLIHQLNPVVGGLSMFLYGLGYPVLLGPLWPLLEKSEGNGKGARSWSAKIKDRLLSNQFARADGILSPTPASAARLPGSARVIPFHLGIDTEQFSPDPSARPDKPTILFLANMQTRKGIFVLLSAFERVLEALPTAELLLAGDGEQLNEVRSRIEKSSRPAQIRLLGRVSRPDVAATMRACSLYCLPSFGEPYGMSALEAMACGKPLVVTNEGGLGYLVPDQGCLKVPSRDASALGQALIRILKDDGLQERMGSFNRDHVTRYHRWDRVVEHLEDIYAQLMQQSSQGDVQLVKNRQELAL